MTVKDHVTGNILTSEDPFITDVWKYVDPGRYIQIKPETPPKKPKKEERPCT